MTDKTMMLLAAYFKLSDAEKQEFKVKIKDNEELGYFEKSRSIEELNEHVKRMTGPQASGRCSLCGK